MSDVVNTTAPNDDPKSKMRSLMIKSVSGKRDLGSAEVTRYLLSEPSYHSEFTPVYLNLNVDIKEIQIENFQEDDTESMTIYKKTLIDFFSNRYLISSLESDLNSIIHLLDFSQKYKVNKNKLEKRNNSQKIIVISFPKIRADKKDKNKYSEYCKYQLIKYYPWTYLNINEIKNQENSIQLWEQYVLLAPQSVKDTVNFDDNLSKQLMLYQGF